MGGAGDVAPKSAAAAVSHWATETTFWGTAFFVTRFNSSDRAHHLASRTTLLPPAPHGGGKLQPDF